VSGYFRTSQIKAAACSFGLLRPCSHRSSVLGLTPILNANALDRFSRDQEDTAGLFKRLRFAR
jgi:hypothetical protein